MIVVVYLVHLSIVRRIGVRDARARRCALGAPKNQALMLRPKSSSRRAPSIAGEKPTGVKVQKDDSQSQQAMTTVTVDTRQ